MDYEELLAQVIDVLKREKRLSYRVLKRQLHLDDDDLEDIKEDLIYAKKLAVDEDGRVLVWTGDTKATPVSTSQPAQTSEQPEAEQEPPAHVEVSPPAPPCSRSAPPPPVMMSLPSPPTSRTTVAPV